MIRAIRLSCLVGLVAFIGMAMVLPVYGIVVIFIDIVFKPPESPSLGYAFLIMLALFVLVGLCSWISWVLALIDSARTRRWRWFRDMLIWGGLLVTKQYADAFAQDGDRWPHTPTWL